MKINKKIEDDNDDTNNDDTKRFAGISTGEMTTFAELSVLWVTDPPIQRSESDFNQSSNISTLNQLLLLLNCVGKWLQVYHYF
jgi:hypothetical protein